MAPLVSATLAKMERVMEGSADSSEKNAKSATKAAWIATFCLMGSLLLSAANIFVSIYKKPIVVQNHISVPMATESEHSRIKPEMPQIKTPIAAN